MLRGLDLFSGIGGMSLALKPWVQTVAYCEIEPYCQAVLMERMQSNDLDIANIWDDVRTLNRSVFNEDVDIIFGGFPCQDISVAGNGEGLEGQRSGLFFEIARITKEYRPRFIFLENVPAICSRGGVEVIETLTSMGYDCRWTMLSASEVGAPHKRERWWLLANANGSRLERKGPAQPKKRNRDSELTGTSKGVANLYNKRLEVWKSRKNCDQCETTFRGDWWESEPAVGRVVNGLPYRVDRIKALGNSVVPQAARKAFISLGGFSDHC